MTDLEIDVPKSVRLAPVADAERRGESLQNYLLNVLKRKASEIEGRG